jgi:hypothetical protein
MAESGKYTADPGRIGAGQDSMEGLSKLVFAWGNQFSSDLSGAQEVLKWDEFGLSAGEQLRQTTSQLTEACMGLSRVLGAIPLMNQAMKANVIRHSQGVGDTVDQAGSKQSQVLPESGGKPGKY